MGEMTKGITIHGLTLMAESHEMFLNEMSEPDSVSSTSVGFPAELVDQLVRDRVWTAGFLNGYKVSPPKDAWPIRWRMLKDD